MKIQENPVRFLHFVSVELYYLPVRKKMPKEERSPMTVALEKVREFPELVVRHGPMPDAQVEPSSHSKPKSGKKGARLKQKARKKAVLSRKQPCIASRIAKGLSGFGRSGVAPRIAPLTVELDDQLSYQHEKAPTTPEKNVMKMIGMLLWVCRCTRADCSYAVSRLASGISRWGPEQLEALTHLVGYIKGTQGFRLHYKPIDSEHKLSLRLYTDASWHCPRSHSGACLCLVQEHPSTGEITLVGMLDWLSSKQSLTADSSASSELIAAHTGVRSILPLAETLTRFWSTMYTILPHTTLMEDNAAAAIIADKGDTTGLRWMSSKAIRIRAGCLKDLKDLGCLEVKQTPTKEQYADCLTKALRRVQVELANKNLGLGRACDFA